MKKNAVIRAGKRVALMFCLLFFITGCAGQRGALPVSDASTQAGAIAQEQTEGLAVHFIDVGQGDATLITCDGHAMLIDAGNNNMGTTVQLYLRKQGIKELDYVVGTHPDADHIGGLDVILYKFPCKQLFMPDCEKDTKTYRDVVDVVKEKQIKRKSVKAGEKYSLGAADILVAGPVIETEDANNSSIVLRVTYKNTSFLFSGDAEETEERAILEQKMDLHADVYKVAHHGSAGANLKEYVRAVSPSYAVISCGKDNVYGHPHKEVRSLLKQEGIRTYRTDEQGSILAHSDGKAITFSTQKKTGNSGISEKEETLTEQSDLEETGNKPAIYVLNENTKKIHLPSCSSVADMKANNKKEVTETLKTLEAAGYSPCKRCMSMLK